MKPVANTLQHSIDTLPGEEIEFGIADPRWVMRSLADLYSNRELAVIREYSTNARDAMVEAGKANEPIIVTLPSAMNPYFTVQDSGIGMSAETLKRRYTQFGDSSKRDSNDLNGMLGYGCKSAVAYTHTFTVTAVKDGHKTVGVITRKPDYSIVLKVVLEVATNEPNGVVVQVPVHNHDEFSVKAKDFYRFWPTGTVLVNNKHPEWAVGDKIADGLYYYPNAGKSYCVMGNVGYQIVNPEALFPQGMNRISFVAYLDPCDCKEWMAADEEGLPIAGSHPQVEFTPNREALKYSEHTKAHLKKIITDFSKQAVDTAKAEIDAATSHSEAFNAWYKWRKVLGANNLPRLSFKGEALTDSYKVNGWRYNRGRDRYNTSSIMVDYLENVPSTLIVTNFSPQEINAHHKKKAREWADQVGNIKCSYIIFTPEVKIASPWVDPARQVDWEQVKKDAPKAPRPIRTPAQQAAWGRKAGSFDLVTKAGRKNEQDVPSTKPLYFCMVQEYNGNRDLQSALKELNLDYEVVLVPANRRDKFLRFYPHAKPIFPELETQVNLDGVSLLSDDAKTYLSIDHRDREIVKSLDVNRVDDPEIKKLSTLLAKSQDDLIKEYRKHQTIAGVLGLHGKFKKHPWEDYYSQKVKPVTKAYPLLLNVRFAHNREIMNHAYEYMNAVYKARKDGKNV